MLFFGLLLQVPLLGILRGVTQANPKLGDSSKISTYLNGQTCLHSVFHVAGKISLRLGPVLKGKEGTWETFAERTVWKVLAPVVWRQESFHDLCFKSLCGPEFKCDNVGNLRSAVLQTSYVTMKQD